MLPFFLQYQVSVFLNYQVGKFTLPIFGNFILRNFGGTKLLITFFFIIISSPISPSDFPKDFYPKDITFSRILSQ